MADVKRTSMNLDRDLVHAAARALGTEGTTATVHAALREAVVVRTRLAFITSDIELESLGSLLARRREDPAEDVD